MTDPGEPLVVVVDGVPRRPAEATIPAWDRGLVYGEGVLESMRSYGPGVFALDEHLERLERSARLIGLDLPWSLADLAREVLLARAQAGDSDVAIRVIVTGGPGARGLGSSGTRTRLVIVDPLVVPAPERYAVGFSAVSMPGSRSPLGSAKTTSYLPHLIASRRARQRGADEALLIVDGLVLEGATSNVFAVVSGIVVTPAAENGVLAGITRAQVLRLARAAGLPTREGDLDIGTLRRADEAFITSTFRELAPLVRLDDAPAFGGVPGSITTRLHGLFRANARAVVASPGSAAPVASRT